MAIPVEDVFPQGGQKPPAAKSQKHSGIPVSAVFPGGTPAAKSTSGVMDRLSQSWKSNVEPTLKRAVGSQDDAPIDSGLKRGLKWIDDMLQETDYGREYTQQVLAAEAQMREGAGHMSHAQGPLAPVEGLGGLAQASLGAIAYLFSPLTTLVEEGAAKPVKQLTQEAAYSIAPHIRADQRESFLLTAKDLQDIEDFGIQSIAGMAGGEAGINKPKINVQAAESLKRKAQTGFEELAAKDPEAAGALADHVGQVDEQMKDWMRAKIDKYKNASDAELEALGREAAQAEIDRSLLSTGEGKASKRKGGSRTASGPSDYSRFGVEDRSGLSTGEGKSSKQRSRVRSGPSDYGRFGEEDNTGLSTGEGKSSPGKSTVRSGPSDYGREPERVGLSTGEGKSSPGGSKTKSGPSDYGKERGIDPSLSTGEGKSSPGKSKVRSGRSGYGDELITPTDDPNIDQQIKDFMGEEGIEAARRPAISSERAGAAIRNTVKDAQESLKAAPQTAEEAPKPNIPDQARMDARNHFNIFDTTKRKLYNTLGANKSVVKLKDILSTLLLENDKIATAVPQDLRPKMSKLLMDALMKHAGDIEVHFDKELKKVIHGTTGEEVEAGGLYHSLDHKIEVFTDHDTVTHTILHEAVHGATVRFMHNNPNHLLTTRMENLRRIAERYHKKIGGSKPYGLTDKYEFVAEAMTNAQFQRFLSRVPVKAKGTLYSRFVDSVKEILGLKGKDSRMLEIAMRTTEDIMAAQSQAAAEGKYASLDAQRNQAVYFNEVGKPVTRGEVEEKFNFGAIESRVPGVSIARGKLSSLYESFIKTFNPEAMGPKARLAGQAIAKGFFDIAHKDLVHWENGKSRREFWQKMGPEKGFEFIMAAESGRKFDNPILEKARIGYQIWANEIYKQDLKTGFTYDRVDHYMPHMFVDSEGVERWMQLQYGTKWADPAFIRQRGFELYRDAVKKGKFTPLHTNPEELMQARQHGSDVAAMRVDLFKDLDRKGVAIEAKPGETIAPEGFNGVTYRSPTGQRYWIHKEAVPLVKNALDSEGLWAQKGFGGDLFRGWMAAKNRLVSAKLSLSLFHPMHVIHIDAAAMMSRATKEYFGGKVSSPVRVAKFMIDMATSVPYVTSLPKTLWFNPKSGYPILRVFQGKMDYESLSAADKQAFHDLTESGMVPTRPMEETQKDWQQLKDWWYTKGMTRPDKLAWHFGWSVLQGISHGMFSVWIPSLKIAAVLKDMKVARELNPNWTAEERQVAARQIARKVEARYGQMNYQSMFMNKMWKDIGVATNLSLGWNLGLLDQYVGGAIDLGKAVTSRGGVKSKLASGILDRPIMAAYYIGTAMMIGGLMHKMFTGKDPEQLIDYTHPESGEVDKFGKPIRLNTMFYTREFEALHKRAEQEGSYDAIKDFMLNKGSGMASMAYSAFSGIDGLGQHFRNEDDPAYKKLLDTLAYEYAELEPISIEALNKSASPSTRMQVLNYLGFTPAGKYISETPLEGRIETSYNKFVRPREKSYTATQLTKDKNQARQAWNTDDPKYEDYLQSMIDKYDMSPKEVRAMQKQFARGEDFDPSVFMFSRLQWDQQKPLLDQMSDEEREKYLKHISKEKRLKYQRETEK